MNQLHRFTTALLVIAFAGCGGGQSSTRLPDEVRLAPARLMPLAPDNVWTYDAYDQDGNGPTIAAIRVVGQSGSHYRVASIFAANSEEEYEIRDQGIFLPDTNAWVLRAPIAVGEEWPTRGRRTARVVSTDETVTTPRGEFSGCVRVDETGGPLGAEVTTVYCADVGVVTTSSSLTAETTGRTLVHRAELREYIVNSPE